MEHKDHIDFDTELAQARKRRLLYITGGVVGLSVMAYGCTLLVNSDSDTPAKPQVPEGKVVASQPAQVEKRYTTTPCVRYIRVGVCGRREKQYNLKVEQCPKNSNTSPDTLIGSAAAGCYFGELVVNEQTYNLRMPGQVFTPTEVIPGK